MAELRDSGLIIGEAGPGGIMLDPDIAFYGSEVERQHALIEWKRKCTFRAFECTDHASCELEE
jgi:hypothetical protein